jgi:phosphoglycolate phosphatase-like HAD superfamily hydrolase
MIRRDAVLAMTNTPVIFWDFDGVIKDSVEVKSQAFIKLFNFCGESVIEKIRIHHRDHGGISRFEKIPLYLNWAGQIPTKERVDQFCENFSQMVLRDVIDSPWVPGVEVYLRTNLNRQEFILVSATPEKELEFILQELNLRGCFSSVWGAPTNKETAIETTLKNRKIQAEHCVMIGDAWSDFEAARANGVNFILRRHTGNSAMFANHSGLFLDDFSQL